MFNLIKFLKKHFCHKIHPDDRTIVVGEAPEETPPNEIRLPPAGNVLLKWQGHPLHTYHWWPMRETQKDCEDTYNNLYALCGGLDKYDGLFCAKSVEYQKMHHYRKYDSNLSDASWAGFCDSASILSCLWEYPKFNVTVTYNSKKAYFTKRDIESLMIVVSYNTVCKGKSCFYGERYNGYSFENKKEPYPSELLKILEKVCQDNIPFVMDIDEHKPVWNYSYNNVLVKSYTSLPISTSVDTHKIPVMGQTIYYQFIMKSDAYKDKIMICWGWKNTTGNTITEDWLTVHPDFIWKKYPSTVSWKGKSHINPELSILFVYKLYMASLSTGVLSY